MSDTHTDGVAEIADRLGTEPTAEAVESELAEWEAALVSITSGLDLSGESLPAGAPAAERLVFLERAVEEGRLTVSGSVESDRSDSGASETVESADESAQSDRVRDAVERVKAERETVGRDGQRLLETVEDGSVDEVVDALNDALDAVETSATLSEYRPDAETVREQLDRADAELASVSASDATARRLEDRLDTLRSRLDRTEDTNPVLPYAAKTEAAFYADSLIESVGEGSPAESGSAEDSTGADATVGSETGETDESSVEDHVAGLDDRRHSITEQYVNAREDHNHTIPLHFLATADELSESATDALEDGEASRAEGVATATEVLLDAVESLYTENEYNVLLRRLRGG